MSRRLLAILSVCCVAALGVSAVALAHGGSSERHGADAGKRAAHAKHAGDGFFGAALDSLAQRLDVPPADLRAAVKAVVAEQRAKPHTAWPPTPGQLAALKTELATSLATKLDKTPDEILTAVRAELDARLTQAVAVGWLTQKGHDLALACFDDPATCDLKALRAEAPFLGHGKQRSGHRRHHRGQQPAPSTTTPPSTATPPSTMTPGARASSTPLR
jgi:hypothetical protein